MKIETPRDLALKVLDRLHHSAAFSGVLVDEIIRSHPGLTERDRAFISHLVQGAIRWRLRIDWIISQVSRLALEKIDPSILNILRLALYQIFFMDRVPPSAAVNEAVRQAKAGRARHAAGFVNGVLRNTCRKRDNFPLPDLERDPLLYRSVFYSSPEWLIRKWDREWGSEVADSLLSASNRIPGLTIRANTVKTDRAGLVTCLASEGLESRPTPFSPVGLAVGNLRGRVDGLKSFREGLFQVQDEAAQVAAQLLEPVAGEKVLDVCAGYGGKTTHLAALMGDRGEVVALDIHVRRLISLQENAFRLGLRSVLPVGGDAIRGLSRLFTRPFDRILLDAPCSGLGVISRHPDIKWNRTEEDIRRLAETQGAMLGAAASLLRPGGKILYVTCTLSREENEGVVKSLLEAQPGMRLENLKDHAPGWSRDLIDSQGFFRTFPHFHQMDGFFGALFSRL